MERKNPAAVALGRLGGLKGGKKGGMARAAALTDEERTEIARKAAEARIKSQTAQERAEIARQAAAKRWEGHKKRSASSRKKPSK